MAILKIKDANGDWIVVPSIVGPPGKDGTMSFEELTEEQRESLRGDPGVQGSSIISIKKAAGDLSGSTLEIQVMDYATNTIATHTFTLPAGADGRTYYPNIDADGNLEWSLIGGGVYPTPDPVNLKGKDGEDGTINGVNALTIQGGDGIEATQVGNTLTIKAKTVETWTFTLEDDSTVTKKVVLV
jgi:hypothetical protein